MAYQTPDITSILDIFEQSRAASAQRRALEAERQRQQDADKRSRELFDMQRQEFEQNREINREKLERTQLEPEAIQGYHAGNPQLLQMVNPELHKRFEEEKRTRANEAAGRQAAVQKAQIERERSTAAVMGQLAQLAPERRAEALSSPYVQGLVRAGRIDPIDPASLEQAPLAGAAYGVEMPKPEKPEAVPYDEAAQRASTRLGGARRGDPRFGKEYEKALREIAAERLARSRAVGGVEKPTKAKFEQEIGEADMLLGEIRGVKDLISSGLVGLEGKLGAAPGKVLDFTGRPGQAVANAIGVDSEKYLSLMEQRATLVKRVQNTGDLILRSRTGAAAPLPEQAKIQKIVGDAENMGVRELMAALTAYEKFLERNRAVKEKAIGGGGSAAPKPTGKQVTVRDRDGSLLVIDESDLEEALADGAEAVR